MDDFRCVSRQRDFTVGVVVRLLAVWRESCDGNGVVVGIRSETASEDSPLPKRACGGRTFPSAFANRPALFRP
jgi:hypothetical protein